MPPPSDRAAVGDAAAPEERRLLDSSASREEEHDEQEDSDLEGGDDDDGGDDNSEEEHGEVSGDNDDESGEDASASTHIDALYSPRSARSVPMDDTHTSDDEGESDADDSAFWDADADGAALAPLPPTTLEGHSIIDVLAGELLQREIPEYMEQFEIVVPDAEIVVGSVPVEEIQQREQDVEEANIRRAELESELYRQREARLAKQEAAARARLLREAKKRHEALERDKLQQVQVLQLRTRRLKYVFQQAENHLKDELQRQQAHMHRLYGDLVPSGVPQSRKRYRAEWENIPMTIQIRVKMLSALKDKLPCGHYVLVVTLYDRLGGHALHWSAWDPEYDPRKARSKRQSHQRESSVGNQIRLGKPNFTRPFFHRGRFFDTEVVVNQSMYVVCPPECALRPGNVLIFELFLLAPANSERDARHQTQQQQQQHFDDQVVAWGAMPLTTPDSQHVCGKFRVPLLRGEMDPTMDKYGDIERMYESDLSSWLCNVYFVVKHLEKRLPRPRGRGGNSGNGDVDDDFDLEIDESTGLFRVENNHQRYMRKLTKTNLALGRSSRKLLLQPTGDDDDVDADARAGSQLRSRRRRTRSTDGSKDPGAELASVDEDELCDGAKGASRYPSSRTLLLDPSEDHDGAGRSERKKSSTATAGSFARVISSTQRVWKQLTSPRKTRVYSGEMVDEMKRQAQLQAEAAAQNTYVDEASPSTKSTTASVHRSAAPAFTNDAADDDDRESRSAADAGDPIGALDVESYKFSVNEATSVETARHKRFHMQRKLHYLRHELLVDLGANNLRTLDFWRFATLLLLSLWVRLYVHYVAQWLFLRGCRVPVYAFQPHWVTCYVKYTWRTVATDTEIGVIVAGVLGNVFTFGLLALSAAVGQKAVGELPQFASIFIVCVGIATVLDPYLVLAVDLARRHYDCTSTSASCAASLASSSCECVDGDAFKLYVRFLAQEGSGIVGVVLTVIVYVALSCLSLVCLYAYLLHVHMNGRMLDVYRRVHGQESDFFVPHDGEIGLADLRAICEHARRWKNSRGTQRKVFVHEYALTDPLDPAFEEKNVHLAVYNVKLDGSRELYRHFLLANDGAILELFGDVDADRGGSWLRSVHSDASLELLYRIIMKQEPAEEDTASPEVLAKLVDGL